ncbi:PLP-dependent aminotransferase family protein [Streptomyces boncukensis]|uniref:PLP-dependent aminotransferase family protein n=1 Tax=Streptomyces boncukensis TaxID=2711219 RepID=A0A6G4WXV0_9ACTN|nr:PLP-dependent aminotransferase family protein [Streptomyces boncukensis]NGO70116.1 PLP-dependent aminotransferase family protein [Streptomyces boncukensis]
MSPSSTRPRSAAAPPALSSRAAAVGGSAVREILATTARPEIISFAGGLPAPELFDVAGLARAYEAVLAEAGSAALQYSTTEGDPGLRAATADRLAARGLPTEPESLLVTSGSQQALTLLATALVEPGDTVLVEDPCYLAVLQVFGFAGARLLPVPCDEYGPDLEALDDLITSARPKLLYTVPTFQNPTGRTMPARRREGVAGLAARRGLWLVEDDPYGELRFEGEEVPRLTAYAAEAGAADRAVLLGSFSKVMAPGMRLGWLRAPEELLRACAVVKQSADLHTPTVNQMAAARYLSDCDLDAHIGRIREVYRERRDALLAGLPQALPDGSGWNRPEGGMFVWARLPDGHDAAALLPEAVAHEVAFVPGAPFHVGTPDPATMRLSFVTHTPDEIAEGLRRLAKTFA